MVISENSFTLKVRDQGVGIPQDKLNDIFDKFIQVTSILSRGAEGSGIGLSLVKKFVDILNGEITIYSKIGVGSEFKLTFNNMKIGKELDNAEDIFINDDIDGRVELYFSDIYS